MRVFKLKAFARFCRKERIDDEALGNAVAAAERGLIDADLGAGLLKLRVARTGKGKSGGYRTLLAYRSRRRAVFLFGFAKSDRDNVDDEELAILKQRATALLRASFEALQTMLDEEELIEIDYDETTQD